jgi:hypothetical protein
VNASKFNFGLILHEKLNLLRKTPSPCPLPPGEGEAALTKSYDKRGEGKMFACFGHFKPENQQKFRCVCPDLITTVILKSLVKTVLHRRISKSLDANAANGGE